MANKIIKKLWVFASSSSTTKHQTLLYEDGSTSCGCPGWTRRCTSDGYRTCRHTRSVDAGTADSECISMVDYTKNKTTTPSAIEPKIKSKPRVSTDEPTKILQRKIRWH